MPGDKTSGYQVRGGDLPVVNAAGESRITAGDFAAAFVDELEANRFLPSAVHGRFLISGGGPRYGQPLDPALEV